MDIIYTMHKVFLFTKIERRDPIKVHLHQPYKGKPWKTHKDIILGKQNHL